MKQPMARRTLLMQTNQPQEHFQLTIKRDVGVVCRNYTAYLRVTGTVLIKTCDDLFYDNKVMSTIYVF